jgi:hypothetical protein
MKNLFYFLGWDQRHQGAGRVAESGMNQDRINRMDRMAEKSVKAESTFAEASAGGG